MRERRARKSRAPVHDAISLPEKLVPTPSQVLNEDVLLHETCPARAAAARAWRALRAAANEPIPRERGGHDLWTADAGESRRLASLVGEGAMQARLLLEVAVLVFTMGCRLGRRGWARSLTAPLAELALEQLNALEIIDDTALAAKHTAAVLAGAAIPQFLGERLSRRSLLSTDAASGGGATADEGIDVIAPAPYLRWRLVGYIPTEELWVLRIGARQTVHLAAPPPLTWCMQGLALSETTPEADNAE